MTDDQNDWAKPEDPQTQQQIDDYKAAQEADQLRKTLTTISRNAVQYGDINRDWVNAQLNRLGAELVTGTSEYKIFTPITGEYGTVVTAASRDEALAKFSTITDGIANSEEIRGQHTGEGVYDVQFTGDAAIVEGPEDIDLDDEPKMLGLEALKVGIRQMLKQAVAGQGWGITYAQNALTAMGLEKLPHLGQRAVQVPVAGTASLMVSVFDDADDDAVQAATSGMLARMHHVTVKPDEFGAAFTPRGGGMAMELVDDDDDDDVF